MTGYIPSLTMGKNPGARMHFSVHVHFLNGEKEMIADKLDKDELEEYILKQGSEIWKYNHHIMSQISVSYVLNW